MNQDDTRASDGRRRFLRWAAGGAGAGLVGCVAKREEPARVGGLEFPLWRIALGSCTDQTKPQPIWDTVLRDRPELVIFAGDNVYASEQPWSLEKLEQAYALQAAVPGFARLRHEIPYLAIWDDHDYGLNDGGAEFEHKAESKAVFLRFWGAKPDDPRVGHEGLYDAQMSGPPDRRVQVILLDTRWFRSPLKATDERGKPGKERYLPDPDPAKTMLGETQWTWLEEQLRKPAQLRLIVSGIQVVAEGHGWERWGNLPLERARLYRLIETTRAEGVVFLSGDRHFGALYRESNGVPYPLYEMTASGITHPWKGAAEAGPNRLGPPFGERHYGMVEIDWGGRSLRLAIKDIEGATRASRDIAFDELKHRT